jgi:tetratricopeptide (TPR) repeat protein
MNGLLSEGSQNTPADNYAYNRMLNNYIPNEILFKARILFDGGFYSKSLEILESRPASSFSRIEEISEYLYRFARNYQELNEFELAAKYFKKVIDLEGADRYYFWGNSLLHLGNIYSRTGELEKAREFYQKATSYKGDEYRNSIKMEARTGLERIEDL